MWPYWCALIALAAIVGFGWGHEIGKKNKLPQGCWHEHGKFWTGGTIPFQKEGIWIQEIRKSDLGWRKFGQMFFCARLGVENYASILRRQDETV